MIRISLSLLKDQGSQGKKTTKNLDEVEKSSTL